MCATRGISFRSFLPSRRSPVPPSKIRMALPARSSTQLVLPPVWTVFGPGVGMLPRTPQKVICINLPLRFRVSPRPLLTSLHRWRQEGYSLHLKSAPAIVVLGCAVQPQDCPLGPAPQDCPLGPAPQDCPLGPDPKRDCHLGPDPKLAPGTLARRIEAAAALYRRVADQNTLVIASGGRRWGGVVEADVIARELARQGVPVNAIVRERCSLSTRDNARFAAA